MPGDTLLGMSLAHGGHLTHGHPLSISGKLYRVVSYGVTRDTERLDYDELQRVAEAEKPKPSYFSGIAIPRRPSSATPERTSGGIFWS